MSIRNLLFDLNILKHFEIPSKSIVIGNLSTGGTGKSPHVLYILSLINSTLPKVILSRGYGRKTKGYLIVKEDSSAIEVGDEPLMFKKRLKENVSVIVSEDRKDGILNFSGYEKDILYILDDAYQHRKVKAGFSILLTDYNSPFFNDFLLPAGNLREFRCGKNRSDCIIVTKCSSSLSSEERNNYFKKLRYKKKPIFFSKMLYGKLVCFGRKSVLIEHVILVTGIANPKPLENWLKKFYSIEIVQFQDHHNFSMVDIDGIHQKIDIFANSNVAIVTTEKDFVRLDTILSVEEKLKYPWYYQPITVKIDEEEKFKTLINKYVDTI
jgi:tetraacyldisaccharide 4'-kinase